MSTDRPPEPDREVPPADDRTVIRPVTPPPSDSAASPPTPPDADDDRTTIRPPAPAPANAAAPFVDDGDRTMIRPVHAPPAPTPGAAPADDDRTMIRPPTAAPAAAPATTEAPAAAVPGAMPPLATAWPATAPRQAPPQPPQPPHRSHDGGNALPVGTVLGEFELTRVLGEGGFGIVYLAQDRSLHRLVALKEYMPSALAARHGQVSVSVKSERLRETFELGLKSFINEARLLAQFDHPSLVKVYRFWEANGTAYMVMPFYEGVTLKDRLRELESPPDEAQILSLLAPLTEALAVIHAENCFHRDIAPDNIILLAGSGRPLLLDFGAARRVIGDMTHALTVILKPGYAPLEQYAEVPSMKQGPWTDVYALAAVVYFAITGRTPPAAVGRLMGDSYEPLQNSAEGRYSAGFLQAIDHALQVRPDDRTPSIAALRGELGLTAIAPPPQIVFSDAGRRRPPAGPPGGVSGGVETTAGRRNGWLIGGGTALLVAGAVAAFIALTPGKRAPAGDSPPLIAAAPPAIPQPPAATSPATSPAPPMATPAGTPAASAASPPPISAAAPPAAAPAVPFTVMGEFDRIIAAQDPVFQVVATTPKARLRIGRDQLKFSVSAAREGYVYVLVYGPDRSLILLHPNSNAKANRISAGQKLDLPPPTAPLETADPPGAEEFLVVVSAVPRSFDSLGAKRIDTLLYLPTGDKAAALTADFHGRGSALIGHPVGCTSDPCDAYGAARFTVQAVR